MRVIKINEGPKGPKDLKMTKAEYAKKILECLDMGYVPAELVEYDADESNIKAENGRIKRAEVFHDINYVCETDLLTDEELAPEPLDGVALFCSAGRWAYAAYSIKALHRAMSGAATLIERVYDERKAFSAAHNAVLNDAFSSFEA